MTPLEQLRHDFGEFHRRFHSDTPTTIFHDVDADGVSAGLVLTAALRRSGSTTLARFAPGRERNAWSERSRALVAASAPQALFVLDLGSSSDPIVAGVPTCFIDHHRPDTEHPPGGRLLSGYHWSPTPTTSLLAHWCAETLTNVEDLEWITALGIISDLGDKAPFELLERARKKYKARWLKEATVLVNAARRGSHFDPEIAARALLSHSTPQELVVDEADPDVSALKEARREVAAAMNEAKKSAPVFAGQIALIRMNSACQVHPLIAQIWRTRLPKYIVIAANEGYLPDRVNFSARSTGDMSALDVLRSYPIEDGEGAYGHGHDQASGGSLPVDRWNALLAKMGFRPEVFAAAS